MSVHSLITIIMNTCTTVWNANWHENVTRTDLMTRENVTTMVSGTTVLV